MNFFEHHVCDTVCCSYLSRCRDKALWQRQFKEGWVCCSLRLSGRYSSSRGSLAGHFVPTVRKPTVPNADVPLPPPFIQPSTQAQGMAPACSKVTLPTQVNLIKTTPHRCVGMCLLGDSRSHQVGDHHKPSPSVLGSREDSHKENELKALHSYSSHSSQQSDEKQGNSRINTGCW